MRRRNVARNEPRPRCRRFAYAVKSSAVANHQACVAAIPSWENSARVGQGTPYGPLLQPDCRAARAQVPTIGTSGPIGRKRSAERASIFKDVGRRLRQPISRADVGERRAGVAVPRKILQVYDVSAPFAGGREGRYTERMNGDGWIETAAASVLFN